MTLLMVSGLAISVASTIFLLLFVESLGFEIGVVIGQSALGFQGVFAQFTLLVTILNFLTGGLTIYFLFSLAMSERSRDIGIMKAFGSLTNSIFSIFATELFITILLGCTVGTAVGTIFLLAANFAIGQTPVANVNLLHVTLILSAFFLLSLFFGGKPVANAIQIKPADAMSPSHMLRMTTEFTGKSLSRFGFAFKAAFRNLMRRSLPTRHLYLCLTLILALVTVAVVGGLTASDTTTSYLERAVGSDVVLVAHKDLINQYERLLLQFQGTGPTEKIAYLDQQYVVSDALIQEVKDTSGVVDVERRLLFETTALEAYGIVYIPDSGQGYYVGEGRSTKTLIMGIEPEKTLNKWFLEGELLIDAPADSALVGQSLATKLFTSPFDQGIIIDEKNFQISGICVDPFNNGNITYLSHSDLSSPLREFGFNLLYTKVDTDTRPQCLDQLEQLLSKTDFETLELSIPLGENIAFLRNVWSLVMLVPFFTLASAFFCLFTFVTFSVNVQLIEFGIMRAVGTKFRTIATVSVFQVLIVLLLSIASGGSLGFILVSVFLIPEPVISITTIFQSILLYLLTTGLLTLLSLIPLLRIKKQILQRVFRSFH